MRFFASVPLGLEEVAGREIRRLGDRVTNYGRGKVFFEGSEALIYLGNFLLKTVNRVFIHLATEKFSSLKDIEGIAASIDYSWIIPPDASFAVRAERYGAHDFTSVDVGRVVGAGVIDSYMKSRGVRLKVDLRNPHVEVYSFVVQDEVSIGVNTTGKALDKRGYRRYNHPAALKATLAAALALEAGVREGTDHVVLDPMCGGGTVVIEAIHRLRAYPNFLFRMQYSFRSFLMYNKELEIETVTELLGDLHVSDFPAYCVDVSRKALNGAKVNAHSALVNDALTPVLGDATLPKTFERIKEVHTIVTNPPYGMRSHNLKKLPGFYRSLLRNLKNLFPGARMAAITAAYKTFREAAEDVGVKVIKDYYVMHGGLWTKIFVLEL